MRKFLSVLYYTSIVILGFAPVRAFAAEESDQLYSPEILIVESDEEAAALEERGVIIWHRRQDMALALVSAESHTFITNVKGKGDRPRHMPRKAVPTMDVAKTYFNASDIHSGVDLPAPYTGAGVVVGFCDVAFDPNHVNFKDKDGNSRVKKLVHYDEIAGLRTILTDPDEIASWTTDNTDAYHATHVAGIMAGSYNANGYGGMAPDAEIVACTAKLYDVGILAACEEILDYAKSVGKPAVINLSLGSYNGPHDGTSLFNRYISLIGKEAIVCMAAGNAGDDHSSCRITFSEQTPLWRVAIQGNDWVHFNIMGITDAWSDDERPVSARFLVYDTDTRTCVYESPLIDFSETDTFELSSEQDAALAEYMTGTVWFHGSVSDLNGRWVTEVEYHTSTTATAAGSGGQWSRYRPALEFSGAPGVHADINADAQYSFLTQMAGYPAPGADLSVSDIATGANVIVVGMYNNRTRIPTLSGTDRVFNHEPFTINVGSGYGTLIDGRVLPHTVAPGGGVVSSCNRYYNLAHPDLIPRMNGVEEIDGEKYYWASDAGTSMSTPYVAGAIATWLEADPTLGVEDVARIISATNFHDYPDALNPRHGQGWFRPYTGLKYVVLNTGSITGTMDNDKLRIVKGAGAVEILNPAGCRVSVNVVRTDGSLALPAVGSSENLITLPLGDLLKGIYIVTARPETGTPVSSKVLIN